MSDWMTDRKMSDWSPPAPARRALTPAVLSGQMETMPRPRTPAAVVLLATVVFGSSTASACLHLQTSFGAARCCTAQHHAAKPCHGGRPPQGRGPLFRAPPPAPP